MGYKESVLFFFVTCGFVISSPLYKDGVKHLKQDTENKTITNEALKEALEYAQMLLSSSYDIPNENYTYHKGDNFVHVSILNGSVTDPSNFIVDRTQVNMTTLDFYAHFTFPYLNISGVYGLNASTDLFKAFGNGPFTLNATGIEVGVDLNLKTYPNNTLYLNNVNFDYNITLVKARFDNLLNDTEACNLMNDLINEFIPDALHDFKPDIDNEGALAAEQYSSFIFNNVTLDQLIDFINSLAG